MEENAYVLGTHDDEIARLGLQHRVWRTRAMRAWQEAGIGEGKTVLDVGCGPGFASLDIARMVGPTGRVVSVDRSHRFLTELTLQKEALGLHQIETHELDLDLDPLPRANADVAWVRWVFAFVKDPRALLSRIKSVLRPGGSIVIHEYFDYSTWRMAPPSPLIEEFVAEVIASWRADGGEPDIGLELPAWLEESGFTLKSIRPIVDIVKRDDAIWQWPATFVKIGAKRLVDLGRLSNEKAQAIVAELDSLESGARARMITPTVGELIATL